MGIGLIPTIITNQCSIALGLRPQRRIKNRE
jgi:hypothetical protein